MQTVLSTKKLSESQRSLLLQAGIGLVEYDAIEIESVDFEVQSTVKNAIITSQNTIKALVNKKVAIENCFCVGEKTKSLLEANGYFVKMVTDYGKELAEILVEKFADEKFTFFCGNLRREELPKILKENNVAFTENEVYKTKLKYKKFERTFDGVLFYSPSGVQSFIKENELKNTTAFCIGTITSAEAEKYTNQIIITTKPTIENVIVKVVNYFKN
ncbi:MAG: uroporphyrinogen-III synthase [Flavobacteriales bacterium]|nr:uroporphyrinogen-III synthase [Flavobacteriales bacterium]